MEMIKTEQYREAAAYLASRIEGNPETAKSEAKRS